MLDGWGCWMVACNTELSHALSTISQFTWKPWDMNKCSYICVRVFVYRHACSSFCVEPPAVCVCACMWVCLCMCVCVRVCRYAFSPFPAGSPAVCVCVFVCVCVCLWCVHVCDACVQVCVLTFPCCAACCFSAALGCASRHF